MSLLAALFPMPYMSGPSSTKQGNNRNNDLSLPAVEMMYPCDRRYFDAARSYGKAEEFLGSWLIDRGISADQVLIGSKWGYYYTAGR